MHTCATRALLCETHAFRAGKLDIRQYGTSRSPVCLAARSKLRAHMEMLSATLSNHFHDCISKHVCRNQPTTTLFRKLHDKLTSDIVPSI
eukprot:473255-Pleurochrysis_carterae.AAC.1